MSEWLPWAPVAAVCCHIVEEFVWPGGFREWYLRYRGNATGRISTPALLVLNGLLVAGSIYYALMVNTPLGAAALLGVCALLCSNGLWHAWASVKTNTISPGVVTGILLYVPLVIVEYEVFLRSHRLPLWMAIVAAAVGGSYHAWSALYHRTVAARSESVIARRS